MPGRRADASDLPAEDTTRSRCRRRPPPRRARRLGAPVQRPNAMSLASVLGRCCFVTTSPSPGPAAGGRSLTAAGSAAWSCPTGSADHVVGLPGRRRRARRAPRRARGRDRRPRPHSPWAETVGRLRCLRGIDTLSAVGLCAEIGDFERFDRAGQLMSYLGVVPSEDSSGERRRQGSITKSGSRHARRLRGRGSVALPPATSDELRRYSAAKQASPRT